MPHTQSVSIAEFAGPVVVEEVGEYVAVEHVVMDMEVIIKDSPMIFFFLLCHWVLEFIQPYCSVFIR